MKKIKLILIAVVALFGASYANAQISVTPQEVSISYGTYQDVVISSEFGIYDLYVDGTESDLDLVDCFIFDGNSRSLGEKILRIFGKVPGPLFGLVKLIIHVIIDNDIVKYTVLIAVEIVESLIENGSPADYLSETLVALKQKDWVIETA